MSADQSVEPVLRSIAKTERHIASEYGTRMVGVMDTIGAYPHFASLLQPGTTSVLSGRDRVDAMYKASVDFAVPQASRVLSQLATDWYVLIENVPTRLWVADGAMRTVQTITMFVTDDEQGLSGEYAWQRCYPAQDGTAHDAMALPACAIANLELHDRLIAAIRDGEIAALAPLLAPTCLWAQRNYLSDAAGGEVLDLHGADAAAQHIGQWHRAFHPEHVAVINRKVTDWFVFAEELWVVRPGGGEQRQYRTATIYAFDAQGRIEAALGAGRDPEAPSPSACAVRGRAFWRDPAYDMANIG